MKLFVIPFAFTALLLGQDPAPVKVTPGTPAPVVPGAPAAPSATPTPPVAPDSVVIEVAGKKYTAGEVDKLIAPMPLQFQQAARQNPQLLNQLFLMMRLAEDAEKANMDKTSPYKEAVELARVQTLAQAWLNKMNSSFNISGDDQQKYYKENPDKFKEVKVKAIYVVFSPAGDKNAPSLKKVATEAEAKAKIEDLRKQIVAGADFGKLARENSDDSASASKDGDFGTVKHSSSFPEQIKAAVYALKKGDVSQPIRQPNGYYLLRVEEMSTQPFDEVNVQIFQEIRQQRYSDWLKGLQAQYTVKVENPAYFTPRQPTQLQQVH